MKIPNDKLAAVLSQYNPWWKSEPIPDLPPWRRAAFLDLFVKITNFESKRAILLSGARQIGKTTLLLQCIDALIEKHGVHPSNILYATFDHPLLKLAGIDATIEAWRQREPRQPGPEYIFLDEAQFIKDWGTWIKLQVDFQKGRKIIFTGSALPLQEEGQESGVGRWTAIKLTTLSFYEYLQIKKLELPPLPQISSLMHIFNFSQKDFQTCREHGADYVAHFHEFLLRGGFPETAMTESITTAQRLLREDIIDKVLKRDMTALFKVRNILELEQIFLYLCLHGGGMLDAGALSKNLEISKATALRYISYLESAHLIYKLPPYGFGKEILRGRYKIYIADAALAPAVLLKGKSLLQNPQELGMATEIAVFKHIFARYYKQDIQFSYWRGAKGQEVDLIAQFSDMLIPFEVKYREQHTEKKDLKGLFALMSKYDVSRGYVVTKSIEDFSLLGTSDELSKKILKIPAPLFCYWLGFNEAGEFQVD